MGQSEDSKKSKYGVKLSEEIMRDKECLDEIANEQSVEMHVSHGPWVPQAIGILGGEHASVLIPCHIHLFWGMLIYFFPNFC